MRGCERALRGARSAAPPAAHCSKPRSRPREASRPAPAPRRACTLRHVSLRARTPSGALCAAAARAALRVCAAAADGDELRQWQELLAELRAASATSDSLLAVVAARRVDVSTRFLLWLGAQAAAAERADDDDEAQTLDALCGRVLAACDGVDDGAAVLAQLGGGSASPALAGGGAALAPRGAEPQAEDFAALTWQRRASDAAALDAQLSARWAALALRGEDAAPLQASRNAASRRRSATELLGRAALARDQAGTVLQPQAEERILEVLLSIPDAADRLAAVDDALTPPEPGYEASPDGDELLFTTPLQLLRAIDLALQRLEGGAAAAAVPLLRGAAGGGAADVEALQQLRGAVLARL